MINGIFDGWDSSGNTLSVGDLLIGVEGNVEVDLASNSSVCFFGITIGIGDS